jgi:hypothetical protein
MRRPPITFNPEQASAILRLYNEEKLSVVDVARRLDLDTAAVWRFLKRRGVQVQYGRGNRPGRKPLPPVAPDRVAEVVRLATAGLTAKAVATRSSTPSSSASPARFLPS